jgi:hypothetical protein
LKGIRSTKDAKIQQSYIDLMSFADGDISKSSNALREVRVTYNPSPHDLDDMPTNVRNRLLESKRKNDELIRRGVVAGHDDFTGDSIRIYKHTLAYLITNHIKYANKAIQLMLSWARTCKVFGLKNENGPLEAGWGLVNMAQSAELLRYTNLRGWNRTAHNTFVAFVDNVLMPNLKYYDENGVITDFPSIGNWGTTIIQARLQYAIYKDDKREFEFCRENARMLMTNILTTLQGRTSETLRDIVHAQYGLAGLSGILELLWHQKNNIYRERLRNAYEYHASILLGNIPRDIQNKKLYWVGFVPANWEMAYNAFVHRFKRFEMPNTKRLLERQRPEAYDQHWGLGTLTHYYLAGR